MKCVLTMLLALLHAVTHSQAAAGLRIDGRDLLDSNGNTVELRGINHPHVWYPGRTGSFAEIKAAGANAVRVVLGSGQRWGPSSAGDVGRVVELCKCNRLLCVLEVHDTTGFGEQGGAATLAQAVAYWQGVQSVLTGEEAYVIINIGNEPYGNYNASQWVRDTSSAIAAMRGAGFRHTLMVDAPNWGQDWQSIMRNSAAAILGGDPDGNTIFSVHMYGVFDTAAEVQGYLASFVDAGLPLVIREFGWDHSDGDPDEEAVIAEAQARGIGWFAWSWSGNGGGVEYLDMVVDFDASRRTSWGDRVIGGPNGLQETSREASIYSGGACPSTSTTATTTITATTITVTTATASTTTTTGTITSTTSTTTTTWTTSTTTTTAPTTTAPTTSTTVTTATSAPSTSATASTTMSPTTSEPTTSSTSTTLPACATTGISQILCLLRKLPPKGCAGETLPKVVRRGLAASMRLLEKAQSPSPKAARRLLRRAAGRLARAATRIERAGAQGKLAAGCVADFAGGLRTARDLTYGLIP